LTFRDFQRDPPGAWLWAGGPAPFARVSGDTYGFLSDPDGAPTRRPPIPVEALRRHGILVDADALDEHAERVATALGLLSEQRVSEAAGELRRARWAAPALTTTWLEEAFTLFRAGAVGPSRSLLDRYLARWPGDPAAMALLAGMDRGPRATAQRGHMMVLAPSTALARELAVRAADAAERIGALCGSPPPPTVLLVVTDVDEAGGRCWRGGSPFARLIELTAGGAGDPTLLAHEVVHATLSSGNLAFTEGLALYLSSPMATPSSAALAGELAALADDGDTAQAIDRLFLDLDAQPGAFDPAGPERARALGDVPEAHWLAFLGIAALVARVSLAALVRYLGWLRDPTPKVALAAQDQLFTLHFRCSLRAALRVPA
jgi:hypothetical protein